MVLELGTGRGVDPDARRDAERHGLLDQGGMEVARIRDQQADRLGLPGAVPALDPGLAGVARVDDDAVAERQRFALLQDEALLVDPIQVGRREEAVVAGEPAGRMPEIAGRVEKGQSFGQPEAGAGIIHPGRRRPGRFLFAGLPLGIDQRPPSFDGQGRNDPGGEQRMV